uniref:RNA-directed RNA polymerase L n=1 Tax=Blattodean phenui-related virus OKIAV261 TaxID=2746240 RepID=A0A7D7J1Y8_9VIRU|nr:RNA-dependent RNA polymerase [Blattodean phenui-related virus OKIAV261]
MGVAHVLELATTRTDVYNTITDIISDKILKYRVPLEIRSERTGTPIVFSVVVVGPITIRSNMPLPNYMVKDLFFRMRMARAIEEIASSQGVIITSDDGILQIREEEIKKSIGKLSLPRDNERGPYRMTKVDKVEYRAKLNFEDKRHVALHLSKVFEAAKKEMDAKPTSYALAMSKWKLDSGKHALSSKARKITNLPLVLVERTKQPNSIVVPFNIPSHGAPPMLQIWQSCLDSACEFNLENSHCMDENEEDGLFNVYLKGDEPGKNKERVKYHRVSPHLRSELRAYAAIRGVNAKSFKDNPFVAEASSERKLSCEHGIDVSDIDDFLIDESWLNSSTQDSSSFIGIKKLIKEADEIMGNKGEMVEEIEELYSTDMAKALEVCSSIAQELAVSVRQSVNKQQFILKKLQYYPIYLLIKPTSVRSHIFFSILIKANDVKRNQNLPFTLLKKWKDFFYTEFRSFTPSKLSNQFVLAQIWIGSLVRWTIQLEGNLDKLLKKHSSKQPLFMANLALLVGMCDKFEVEAEMSLSRYMYMEVFKNPDNRPKPDPLKMVAKFNPKPRCRLTRWVQGKLLKTFGTMLETPPRPRSVFRRKKQQVQDPWEESGVSEVSVEVTDFEELPEGVNEKDLSRDLWNGLLNCYSGALIQSVEDAVNIMYSGYFKDKNESGFDNSHWNLIEKILEEEWKIDSKREQFYGLREPPPGDIRSHEFSVAYMKYACQIAREELQKTYGKIYSAQCSTLIIRKLAHVNSVQLATLKASAVIDDTEDLKLESMDDLEKSSYRVKCMEAVALALEDIGSHPFCRIDKIVKSLEEKLGSIACDIFKKSQHCSIREIYVLTFSSRCVQLFIETAARTLCEQFRIDTLTHPEDKNLMIDEHMSTSAQLQRLTLGLLFSGFTSGDRTRWNQNIVVRIFGLIFTQFLTPDLSEALMVCLNLWYKKIIKLPPGVQRLLINNVHLESDVYERLLTEFWSTDPGTFQTMAGKVKYIRTLSGMCQGILHYASSLMHVMERLAFRRLCYNRFLKKFPNCRLVCTVMCCSDDYATMLTAVVPRNTNTEDKKRIQEYINYLLCCQPLHGRLCNMMDSVKSTHASPSVSEYNSLFLSRGTAIVPTVKFWEAGLKLQQTESLKQRLLVLYNVLRALMENGSSFLECRVMQILQAHIHYKALGSDLSKRFNLYSDEILKVHDLDLGFFPMDEEECPGLLGLDYVSYILATVGKYGKSLRRLLVSGAIDCDKFGELVGENILTFGNRKRVEKLKEKVVMLDDWEEELNNIPEILYRPVEGRKEAALMLCSAANSPGVHESLNSGNSFFNSVTSSVYINETACITIKTHGLDKDGKMETVMKKTSLLGAIREKNKQTIPDMPIHNLFPAYITYNEIRDKICQFKGEKKLCKVPRIRKKVTKMTYFPLGLRREARLRNCARAIWFGHDVKLSMRTIQPSWNKYKDRIPWLRDTAQETLKESPFLSHVALKNYIESNECVKRTVRLVAPPVRKLEFLDQLQESIISNFSPGYRLVRKEIHSSSFPEHSRKLSSTVSLILLYPNPPEKKLQQCLDAFKSHKLGALDNQDLGRLPRQLGYLAVIHWVGSQLSKNSQGSCDITSETDKVAEVLAQLKQLRDVVTDYFVTRQLRDKGGLIGRSTVRLQVGTLLAEINTKNGIICKMTVNSLKDLHVHCGSILDYVSRSDYVFMQEHSEDRFLAVACITGVGIVPHRMAGTPIFIDTQLVEFRKDVSGLTLFLEVEGSTIRLMSRQRYCYEIESNTRKPFSRVRSLCFFKADETTAFLHIGRKLQGNETSIERYWIGCQQAPSDVLAARVFQLKEYTTSVIEKDEPLDPELDEECRWFRATFKARLASVKAIMPVPKTTNLDTPSIDLSTLEVAEQEAISLDEILQGMEEDFDPLMGETFSGNESVTDTDNLQLDMEVDDIIQTEGLEAAVSILQSENLLASAKDTIYSSHPLWDNFINEMEKMDPGALRLVAEGRVSRSPAQPILEWLLERRSNPLDVTGSKTRLAIFFEQRERDAKDASKERVIASSVEPPEREERFDQGKQGRRRNVKHVGTFKLKRTKKERK